MIGLRIGKVEAIYHHLQSLDTLPPFRIQGPILSIPQIVAKSHGKVRQSKTYPENEETFFQRTYER